MEEISWKQRTDNFSADVRFSAPATEDRIARLEEGLSTTLPKQLRSILLETDGCQAEYGTAVIWPASEIETQNRDFRTNPGFRELYMPFDHLLFFGEDSGGDLFGYAIHADGRIHKHDIFRWNHETDAREWFAGHLEHYLQLRLTPGANE